MKGAKQRRRVGRIAATVGVVVAALVTFAALAGIGLAGSSVSASQYGNGQYGKKVTICHKGKVTITVSVNALPAHKRHGDVVGTCAQAKAKKAKKNATAAAASAKAKKNATAAAASTKEKENGKPAGSEKPKGKG